MRGLMLTCVLAGCFSPAPQAGAPCADNRDCPSGLECTPDNRCERPGTYVPPDACAALTCEGDNLVGCGMVTTCPYGCDSIAPHCLRLAPSNGVTVGLLDGVTADVTQADLDLDTDDGTISSTNAAGDTTVIRPAGTGVIAGIRFEVVDGNGVFAAHSWTISSADDWDGAGNPPLVLFAATTITVSSALDVGGTGTSGGPGATNANNSTTAGGCRGRAGRSNSGIGAAFGEGGGGGGGAMAGGDGAASNQANPTGQGGSSCTTSPSTIPLRGGSGGGHGGQDIDNGGGGGGGAVMLVAMESVTVSGAVTAPGAGGRSATTGAGGGGGGGSGGAILIEAPMVSISGQLTTNGGGGGAPAGGNDGTRGSVTSASPAAGGTFSCVPSPGATPVTRRGGAGAAGMATPADGTTCTVMDAAMVVTSSQGGGGGGAVGRIEVRRAVGGITGLASPAALLTNAVFE